MSTLFSFFSSTPSNKSNPNSSTSQPVSDTKSSFIHPGAARALASAARTVEIVKDRHLASSTKEQYKAKINTIKEFLRQTQPNLIDNNNGEIKLPLSLAVLEGIFGHLVSVDGLDTFSPGPSDGHGAADIQFDETLSPTQSDIRNNSRIKFATVRGYKSALKSYCKNLNHPFSAELDNQLEQFLSGYQKMCAKFKLDGVMNIYEGKQHLTFSGYRLLAKKLFELGNQNEIIFDNYHNDNSSIQIINNVENRIQKRKKKKISSYDSNSMMFSWTFLVLQWNMMARSGTVASIMLQHIKWEEDAMVLTSPMHKGDQTGARTIQRHLYSNPLDPVLCPVLALAVLMFSKSIRTPNENQKFRLFEGDDQEGRFSKTLGRVLKDLNDSEEKLLGCKKKEIGTHSARKGAPSYCLSMVDGPSAIPVYLRAGWSLGKVQDQYLFLGKGADQLTGRTVSGLPMSSIQFASLPVHFSNEFLKEISKSDWELILPGYNKFPECFQQTVPYLVAAITKHENFLKENLEENHPLFSCNFLRSGKIAKFRNEVLCGEGRCPVTKLTATGIPSNLSLICELNLFKQAISEVNVKIDKNSKMLPGIITSEIFSKFTVNGAIPLTAKDMELYFANAVERISNNFESRFSSLKDLHTERTSISTNNINDNSNEASKEEIKLYERNGKYFRCPASFTSPKCGIRDIWMCWWFGHSQKQLPPYRFFDSKDLISNENIVSHSKISKIISEIVSVAKTHNFIDANEILEKLDEKRCLEIFDKCFDVIGQRIKKKLRNYARIGEVSVGSLYRHLFPSRKTQINKRKRKIDQIDEIDH